MGKFINKALFYKEWKIARWLLMGLLAEFLFLWVFSFTQTIYQCKQVFIGKMIMPMRNGANQARQEIIRGEALRFFNNFSTSTLLIIIISIVIVASIIIGTDRFNKNFSGLVHMPFRREEIIITKWLIGILVVEVPIILTSLAVFIMYYHNIDMFRGAIDIQVIVKWFTLNSLVYGFILTFTMLIQCLTSISPLGAVFSLGLLFLPSASVWFFIISILGTNSTRYEGILNKIIAPITLTAYNFEFELGGTVYVLPAYLRVLILLLAIEVCFQLMKYYFKRNQLEKVSNVITFDKLKIPFKISAALGFGIIGTMLVVFTLTIEPSLTWIFTFTVLAIPIYFLADKTVKSNA